MDGNGLRDKQRPLKVLYKGEPTSAMTPLRATARLAPDGEGITVSLDTWAGTTRAGLHTATGGDGSDACSGDMLLEALAACAGVTLRSVATATGVALRAAAVEVEGQFDARGTLGVDPEAPVGLTDVTLTFVLDTDADQVTVDRLCELAERYCVVGRTLQDPPTIDYRHRRGPVGA